MFPQRLAALLSALLLALAANAGWTVATEPAWATAHLQGPLGAEETRQFMRELAQFVFDHHLKKDANSPQRGMVYEYFCVPRQGQFDQFVQGEALDTMHDGAWLAAAMVNASRATGDPFYKAFLIEWQLPFYLKMLNHSSELFTAKRNDARPDAKPWGKEWAFQEGENGFVPYFWDDGGSVSIERRHEKNRLGIAPCVDYLADKPNPNFLLDGYSQGSSNHMAQDLGVMVQMAWLLLRESADAADRKLAEELAAGAKNLYECRVRHHGPIPMCTAPAALACGDARLMRQVPAADDPKYWLAHNAYTKALVTFTFQQRESLPGFADDQQYRYYFGIAKTGGQVPEALAFRTIYDAYTVPLLYRSWSDDASVPAGVNRFDLHPYYCVNGKHTDYRSDRKGPRRGPRPWGSRLGPQNMICCGWALQMLRAMPEVWESPYKRQFADDLRVYVDDPLPTGKRLPLEPATVEGPGTRISLLSTRSSLRLSGTCQADTLSIRIHSRPNAEGSYAAVTLGSDGKVEAVNDRGEKLLVEADVKRQGAGCEFALSIPYTVVKEQKPWLNGVEHGRYSIAVGGKTRNFYLASSRQQVEAWLEHELGAGLRTWRAVFREKGHIPTGVGAGFIWDDCSDSGGYAHLISAASQWLFCLEGKNDWEVHRVPAVPAAQVQSPRSGIEDQRRPTATF